jgi:hypothetical protein
VAVMRRHADCAGHLTKAAYSCLRGVYVLHGTNAPHHQGSTELRRITLPRTRVNRPEAALKPLDASRALRPTEERSRLPPPIRPALP